MALKSLCESRLAECSGFVINDFMQTDWRSTLPDAIKPTKINIVCFSWKGSRGVEGDGLTPSFSGVDMVV